MKEAQGPAERSSAERNTTTCLFSADQKKLAPSVKVTARAEAVPKNWKRAAAAKRVVSLPKGPTWVGQIVKNR